MENHTGPAEARAALDSLDSDGARLAARVVTPWWYHPILGAIVAVIVAAQALPGTWSVTLPPVSIIAILLLMHAYKKHSGVATTQPAGPRSKRLLLVTAGIMILALTSAVALKLTGSSPWWVMISAAIAALATVVLGRRYDAALRAELALPVSAQR